MGLSSIRMVQLLLTPRCSARLRLSTRRCRPSLPSTHAAIDSVHSAWGA